MVGEVHDDIVPEVPEVMDVAVQEVRRNISLFLRDGPILILRGLGLRFEGWKDLISIGSVLKTQMFKS